MDKQTRTGILILVTLYLAGVGTGLATGYGIWGIYRSTADQRTLETGIGIISGLAADQQAAISGVEAVQGNITALTAGIDRSLEHADRVESRLGNAADYNRDLTSGIDRSIHLTEISRERLGELEGLIRELSTRNSFSEGSGD